MSIQSEIDRISGAVSDALAALTAKGVTVSNGTKVDGLAELIAAIEAGCSYAGGTITPAEASRSITIEHNLGRKPVLAVISSVYKQDTIGNGTIFNVCVVPYNPSNKTSVTNYLAAYTDNTGTFKVLPRANANITLSETSLTIDVTTRFSTSYFQTTEYAWYMVG